MGQMTKQHMLNIKKTFKGNPFKDTFATFMGRVMHWLGNQKVARDSYLELTIGLKEIPYGKRPRKRSASHS
jgi:hypothetical protein